MRQDSTLPIVPLLHRTSFGEQLTQCLWLIVNDHLSRTSARTHISPPCPSPPPHPSPLTPLHPPSRVASHTRTHFSSSLILPRGVCVTRSTGVFAHFSMFDPFVMWCAQLDHRHTQTSNFHLLSPHPPPSKTNFQPSKLQPPFKLEVGCTERFSPEFTLDLHWDAR